jgi:dihydropteroate synthase
LPEVVAGLRRAIAAATARGISRDSILVDPGIGFGKKPEHNLMLLRHLPVLRSAGFPVLVGASRKSFLGRITGEGPEGRMSGSLAVAALAVFQGASALRVHDVRDTVRAARVAEAIRDARLAARQT